MMLPAKIPNSRVFTYDWPAGVDGKVERIGISSMLQKAQYMLFQLRENTVL